MALIFLLLAIVVAVFGTLAAGPVGLLLLPVFLGLSVWYFARYLRERRQR